MIDAGPVGRLVDLWRERIGRVASWAPIVSALSAPMYADRPLTARERTLIESVLQTMAIEVEHAIEEGRQNARMHAASLEPVAPAVDVVRLPVTGYPLEAMERDALLQALTLSRWNQQEAAELLSLTPRIVNYKMQRHGIQRAREKEQAA